MQPVCRGDSEAPRGTQVVRRWEYGLLSDTSSVTYVQVPADTRGGRFRFWDPREHDWSIIHRAQVPPPTREIATEARPRPPRGALPAPCSAPASPRPAPCLPSVAPRLLVVHGLESRGARSRSAETQLERQRLDPNPTPGAPQENLMVEFRGDALHGLEGFTTATGLPRVSLVCKQYKLSPGDYAFSPNFQIVS